MRSALWTAGWHGKHIGASLGRIGTELLGRSADHGSVPAYGHGLAEVVSIRAIAGGQLLLLGPGAAAAREDIGHALTQIGTDRLEGVANHDGVSAHSHGIAEAVIGQAVRGNQLML